MAKDQQKTQKGQGVPEFDEDQARAHFEKLRWPNGPVCVHCGSEKVTRIEGKSVRPGLIQCNDCREQFTVTVGTVMEDSHLPLAKWVKAFHFMASSKKGMSALQLQRNLGLGSYRTAWHLAHRIRFAMNANSGVPILKGDVQCDETYIGPSRHSKNKASDPKNPRKRGRGTSKTPVMVLVETNGNARSQPMERLDSKSLKAAMESHIQPDSRIVTDELYAYRNASEGFHGGHSTVNHSEGEYVALNGLHTNTAESFFALLKRGIHGTFHHVSKKHLHRYCHEFDFRWCGRKMLDTERRDLAITQIEGKRLFLFQPVGEA